MNDLTVAATAACLSSVFLGAIAMQLSISATLIAAGLVLVIAILAGRPYGEAKKEENR